MKKKIVDGHILITASEGYFLANANRLVYGIELWLGINDSPDNYQEYPISEYPKQEDPPFDTGVVLP